MQILRQCEDAPIWCGIMEQILCHVKRDWLSSSVGTSREAPFEGGARQRHILPLLGNL
jgi:hypothetical protein